MRQGSRSGRDIENEEGARSTSYSEICGEWKHELKPLHENSAREAVASAES